MFTTLTGLLSKNCLRLLTAISIKRCLDSFGAHEIWGVIIQFFALSRGLSIFIGSVDTTVSTSIGEKLKTTHQRKSEHLIRIIFVSIKLGTLADYY